jgi:uncharacterized repeat protein (TIGR04076 family)
MATVKITVLKTMANPDLVEEFCQATASVPCPVFTPGQEFYAQGSAMPEGFCSEAWQDIHKSYMVVQHGGTFRGWMKDEGTIIACCADGLRPVVFELKRIEG